MVFSEVLRRAFQQGRVVLKVAKASIAFPAKQTANFLTVVAVIDCKNGIAIVMFSADRASIFLPLQHLCVFGNADAVSRFEILTLSLMWICSGPLFLILRIPDMFDAAKLLAPERVLR